MRVAIHAVAADPDAASHVPSLRLAGIVALGLLARLFARDGTD
ncbi:hypothetical protein [Rubellimicrobium arenae]|nr:hypothetical protein [Rubellimicrobium arenae]